MRCAHCKVSRAEWKCGGCQNVQYCSRACGEQDWNNNHHLICMAGKRDRPDLRSHSWVIEFSSKCLAIDEEFDNLFTKTRGVFDIVKNGNVYTITFADTTKDDGFYQIFATALFILNKKRDSFSEEQEDVDFQLSEKFSIVLQSETDLETFTVNFDDGREDFSFLTDEDTPEFDNKKLPKILKKMWDNNYTWDIQTYEDFV